MAKHRVKSKRNLFKQPRDSVLVDFGIGCERDLFWSVHYCFDIFRKLWNEDGRN